MEPMALVAAADERLEQFKRSASPSDLLSFLTAERDAGNVQRLSHAGTRGADSPELRSAAEDAGGRVMAMCAPSTRSDDPQPVDLAVRLLAAKMLASIILDTPGAPADLATNVSRVLQNAIIAWDAFASRDSDGAERRGLT